MRLIPAAGSLKKTAWRRRARNRAKPRTGKRQETDMTRRTGSTLFAILAWAGLTAAAPPLATKDQILAAYAGNTLFEDAPTYNWAAFYEPQGTARGRGWNWLGGESATGRWRVTDDGLFCVTWDRENWAGGTENCYQVKISGEKTEHVHVSGETGGDHTLVIKSGNPYDL